MYGKEQRTFKVYYRPIWNWILDLIRDARVVSKFKWDACRLYKYSISSKRYVRFFDEPWTADRFWDIQVCLIYLYTYKHILIPKHFLKSEFSNTETKPFSIVFYADKNKLSSFGTQKGYPVIARCANLPVEIRNGDGIGGGIIIGWLLIVWSCLKITVISLLFMVHFRFQRMLWTLKNLVLQISKLLCGIALLESFCAQ